MMGQQFIMDRGAGTLFVVATPIGNLEDLTLRAVRTLRDADLVAAEDTRRTAKLLAHYAIQKPVVSLREHNEARETPRLVARLQQGATIALVSDAGTPGIADPGTRLVREARAHDLTVVPIPGPTAIATALSASGFPADRFVFLGFPPATGSQRAAWFQELHDQSRTAVFFEAPHRIDRTLREVYQTVVNRPILVCRELTKINEQLVLCTNIDNISHIKSRGEFTIVVGPSIQPNERREIDEGGMVTLFYRLTNNELFSLTDAVSLVSRQFGVPVTRVKKVIKRASILVKRQNIQSS